MHERAYTAPVSTRLRLCDSARMQPSCPPHGRAPARLGIGQACEISACFDSLLHGDTARRCRPVAPRPAARRQPASCVCESRCIDTRAFLEPVPRGYARVPGLPSSYTACFCYAQTSPGHHSILVVPSSGGRHFARWSFYSISYSYRSFPRSRLCIGSESFIAFILLVPCESCWLCHRLFTG